MCFYSKDVIPFVVAVENLVVYKIMLSTEKKRRLKSYYFNKIYDVGRKYKEEMRINVRPRYIPTTKYKMMINNGFHSYSLDRTMVANYDMYVDVICTENGECVSTMVYSDNLVIAKCIIPEGSKYYENDLGEIVSNRIIITGETIAFD